MTDPGQGSSPSLPVADGAPGPSGVTRGRTPTKVLPIPPERRITSYFVADQETPATSKVCTRRRDILLFFKATLAGGVPYRQRDSNAICRR